LLSTNSRVGIWTHNIHLLALLLHLYQPPQFRAPILCIIPSFDGICLSYFSTISGSYVVCTNVGPLLSSDLVINLTVNNLPKLPHYHPGRLSTWFFNNLPKLPHYHPGRLSTWFFNNLPKLPHYHPGRLSILKP